jgi:hypothetical protein
MTLTHKQEVLGLYIHNSLEFHLRWLDTLFFKED